VGVRRFGVLGEDDDTDRRTAVTQLDRDPDPLVGEARGHPDVGHHHVRAVAGEQGSQRGQVGASTDHLEVRLLVNDEPNALPNEQGVLGDRHPQPHAGLP
jgi:hypothetical protein